MFHLAAFPRDRAVPPAGPHRGRRHDHAETFQFANDTLISPAWIFARKPNAQRSNLTIDLVVDLGVGGRSGDSPRDADANAEAWLA